MAKYTTHNFIRRDTPKNFFPLEFYQFLARVRGNEIGTYINEIFKQQNKTASFIQCPQATIPKDKFHTRKVLLLDPIAYYYLYDFSRKNAKFFTNTKTKNRESYGYTFSKGMPSDSFQDYHTFRRRKYTLKQNFKYCAKIDIFDCFNSFYHHNIAHYIHHVTNNIDEYEQFGQFLREIHGGVSIGCFPQGYYPAKMIGNAYLSFIEQSINLQSDFIIRFLDDIYLFSNRVKPLQQDIRIIQDIISYHNLRLNSSKTKYSENSDFEERHLDDIKKKLLRKREDATLSDDEEYELVTLSDEESEYLESLVKQPTVAEEDVELALALAQNDFKESQRLFSLSLEEYPSLIKGAYRLLGRMMTIDFHATRIDHEYDLLIKDKEQLKDMIYNRHHDDTLGDYELFWLSKMIIDCFELDVKSASCLFEIFEHKNASHATKSLILSMDANEFGFGALKVNYLKNSPSNLIGASAMFGLLQYPKGQRNQIYKYCGRQGYFMHTMHQILRKL